MGFLDSKTTTVAAPWKPAQPYIQAGMKQAGALLKKGAGFQAPKFSTVAPMSAQTTGALSGMEAAAQGPNPLAAQSQSALSGIMSGDTNAKYDALYAGADNPHWADAVQHQSDLIGNDVQRQFSGLGRSGSAADTGALVQQLGDYRTGALSSHWDQNIANQRGILGDQTQGQLNAVAAAPGAYDQTFAPYRVQAQVGSAYDDLAQRQLQARLDKFNTNQQAPWNRLGAYNGAISGTGGTTSGFGSSTVAQPFNWAGAGVGLGLGALSLATGGTTGGLARL